MNIHCDTIIMIKDKRTKSSEGYDKGHLNINHY